MNDDLRKSGLEMIGDVPWGTHFCQFYQSPQDLLDILVPYFKAGLETNEFCMWVTSEPLGVEAARSALRSVVPDLETYVRRGQLEIIPHTDWYLKGGAFDADRVLDGWVRKLEEARAAGFDGLRLTGNTFWLEPKDWRAFTDYEASVDNVIGRYRMLAVCTYSVDRCGFTEILDVIRNHRFALVRREGRWELVESAERRRAMDALQKSEEKFRSLFESMTEGFALHEIVVDGRGRPVDYRFLDINPAFERLTGLRREEVLGRKVSEVLPGIEPFWIQTYGRVALSGEPVTFERYYAAPLDRTYQTYAYRPAPGQFAVVFMDVSGRKRTEVALQESHEELEVTTEELRQQNEELLCVQQALQESEERFHVALRNMPVTVATLDRDLKYTWVHNPRGGFDQEEVVGRLAGLSLGPKEGARLVRDLAEVLATGRPLTKEALSTGKSGEEIVFEIHAEPMRDRNGLVSGVAMVSLDITERKRMEGELTKKSLELQSLFNNTNAGLVLFDAEPPYTVLAHNRYYQELFAEPFRSQGMVGKNIYQYAPAVEAQGVVAVFDEVVRTGKPLNYLDFPYDSNPPQRSWFNWHLSPIIKDGRVVALASMSINVTDRHLAEARLRESEARLNFALETSRTGAWDLDLTDHTAFRSPGHDRIFGYAETLPQWTYEMFLDHVLPEDRADVDAKFGAATASGSDWNFECRIRRTDGEVRWIWAAGRHSTDAAGGQRRMTGIVQDITARKRAEERMALRTAVTELLAEAASLEEAAPRLLEIVGRSLGFAAGELWLVDAEAERLRRACFWQTADAGLDEMEARGGVLEYRLGEGVPGSVWDSGEPLWAPDIDSLPELPRSAQARRLGLRSVFAFPARLGVGTLGVVALIARETRPADPDLIQVSKVIGLQLGQFMLRKQAEAALATSLGTLEAVVNFMPAGVVLIRGSDLRLQLVNPTYHTIAPGKDMLGRTLNELWPETGRDFEALCRRVLENGEPYQVEDQLNMIRRRPDGPLEPAYFSWSLHRVRMPGDEGWGIINTAWETTERKKAEALNQALAEQERLRLGAAVEQASDAVVMVDLDGTIRYVNAAFESLNGVTRDQAVGRSYFGFLAAQSPALDSMREAVAQGRPWHGPLAGTVHEGRPVELEVTFSAVTNPAGTVIGGLVTEKDVTHENALQRQVRQTQKMEALGTLAGGITHDFNNILGAIIINTELALLELESSHPGRRPLPLVLQAANRGKELVKQIITFSRQREWERKPMEIAPAVKEALKFLRSTLSKGITIHEAIDGGCGAILADPSHIHQIMVNLCQNAALAMQEGPGTLGIRLEPMQTDAILLSRHPELKPGSYVRLTVSDTGCGIEREHLERIFEPFFTTRGPGRGSGLGLAVVLGIVKSYEGTISVYSEPGKGSVFTVYLPRLEGRGPSEPEELQPQPLEGRERVLLVDDEETQRSSLALGLKRLGYSVTPRAAGRSALSLFRKNPAAFDVVITDQTMPHMSGLELAAELVTLRPGLPVILCTGFSEKVNGTAIGRTGVRAFIMKPFTLQEITRLIREAVEKKNPPAAN